MGGHCWLYMVPFQAELNVALEQLRNREFAAGRYNPAQPFLNDLMTSDSPDIGAQHPSIAAALKASGASGTRSILDMNRIAQKPANGVIVPLPPARLRELFGTERPTREMILGSDDYLEDFDRGQGIYMIVYADDKPVEICFTGCSYD
jgi:hypothetical protein